MQISTSQYPHNVPYHPSQPASSASGKMGASHAPPLPASYHPCRLVTFCRKDAPAPATLRGFPSPYTAFLWNTRHWGTVGPWISGPPMPPRFQAAEAEIRKLFHINEADAWPGRLGSCFSCWGIKGIWARGALILTAAPMASCPPPGVGNLPEAHSALPTSDRSL